MNEIVFLSGKGGTGKTSMSASCAFLQGDCITCDYDVEASNMHMLFKLRPQKVESISTGQLARIDLNQCVECRLCQNLCRFEAIEELIVKDLACEGCGLCFHICPVQAVSLVPRTVGDMFQSSGSIQAGHFHANIRAGSGNSGKVVSRLKDQARSFAAESGIQILISDGPPGIGCSVIASLTSASLVVIVTEPGLSAFDDLQRLWQLLCSRQVPAVIVINKWDLNPGYTELIEKWARENKLPLAGRIPFSEAIANSIAVADIPAANSALASLYEPVWQAIKIHASI